MDSVLISRLWMMRLLYICLALLILFFHLLPLNTVPTIWAPPDLLIALTMAWVLRRPDFVPLPSIAIVMLGADLLLQRPPGLMAALTVGACAYLQSNAPGSRETSFFGEWATVGSVLITIAILNRVILAVTAVGQAPLALVIIQLAFTIAVYPFVVWVSQAAFGVRRLAPSEAEALGARS